MRSAWLALALLVTGRAMAQTPESPGSDKDAPRAEPEPPAEEAKPQLHIVWPTPPEPSERRTGLIIDHHPDAGFRFGSYGRVIVGSDLRGGKPQKILVVAHGPRIVEDSYLELEFSYGFERQEGFEYFRKYIIVRPIITIAFDGTLFHDTGELDAHPAIRNMFLDGRIGDDLKLWVGSRMYRGDDIYLFDYWPLDDQNTIGAGVQYSPDVYVREEVPDQLQLAAHVGFNRLNQPFQFQQIEVPNPVQGATVVEQLNRQRVVTSASAAYVLRPIARGIGTKLKLHGEFHALPSGTQKQTDGSLKALPADSGVLIGAQLGFFGFSDDSRFRRHINLFTRYAKGLAAFDELAPPTTFGSDLKTSHANELTFGLSGNWDHELGTLMVGALSRRFVDADREAEDPDDGWEYAVDARPLARIVPDWFVGGDVSYQARFPRGINPITLRASDPGVLEIAPMVAWSPMGPSSYDRPQIRLVYRAAHLNQGALDLYVPGDPRHDHPWVYFLGFQAEWWFNSSTYH